MENDDATTTDAAGQAPQDSTALAVELSRLKQAFAAEREAKAKIEAEVTGLRTELGAVRESAHRERVIGSIAGDFTSRVALDAVAQERWEVSAGAVERVDGMTDEAYAHAQAKALRDNLAAIEGGALLRASSAPQSAAGGGDITQGSTLPNPRSIYTPRSARK